ncbi:MAG: hypothetical protein OEY36_02270 [Gammaproteobacteria bacterium]|nr:hypothetical protein [Gammaproteobacteria bacterium]
MMTANYNHRVKALLRSVGSWGWRHPEWEKDVFYPDDLPADWQLSYYANEFDLVVVPASYWGADGYTDEDWLDDVEEDFVFYIDWPFLQLADLADYPHCAQACRQLGGQMAAVLVNNDIWQQLDKEQRDCFEAETAGFEILQYGSQPIAAYQQLTDAQNPVLAQDLATTKLLLVHSEQNENLRDLSQRIMPWFQASSFQHVILAEGDNMARLKELQTLTTLLPEAIE